MISIRGGASVLAIIILAGVFGTTTSLASALALATREQLMAEYARVIATAHAQQCATFGARLVHSGTAIDLVPRRLFGPTGPACEIVSVSSSADETRVRVHGWHAQSHVVLTVSFEPTYPSGFLLRTSVGLQE